MKRARRTRIRFSFSMGLISALILIVTAGNVCYWLYQNDRITTLAQTTQEFIEQSDAQATELRAKRIAEEKAREAAAQAAAEEAAHGSSAGLTDSTVCNSASSHKDPSSIDIVVNKKHCIQPVTFEPPDLVTSNGATLSAKAIDAFNQLYLAATAAGQPFYVTSSYRSYATQVSTYNYWVSTSGRDEADTYSARPGYSEHQTGFAFDVAANGCTLDCFGSTSQYVWLQQHAADYGFIQRYYAGSEAVTGYKAEEWHYRYVGVPVAKDMRARGIKTLEEYWSVSGGGY